MPKDNKTNTKTIPLTQGLYLSINYCEKNRPPIYEIDFVNQPTFEWISLKMPTTFTDKYGNLTLCYKTEDNNMTEPLTDIEILITERKRMGEDKEVFILPSGYKIINNNPIAHSYLIYKRSIHFIIQ